MNEIAQRIASLSSDKRRLLDLKLKGDALRPDLQRSRPEWLAITPASREGPLPLSYAQERLWLLDQLDPGNFIYNMAGAIRITGELQIDALERTLSEIVARHEVFRTRFASGRNGPVQIIDPANGVLVDKVDLGNFNSEAQKERLREMMSNEATHRFDLSLGPLLRARLAMMGDGASILLLTMHHIVCDGWSLGVLAKEFAQLYETFSQGKNSALP